MEEKVLDLKQIEEDEYKDDVKLDIDEIELPPEPSDSVDDFDDGDEEYDEDEDDFDDEDFDEDFDDLEEGGDF